VWKQRDYLHHFWERFGWLPAELRQTTHGSIWIHAVSVGEIISAAGLIEELRGRYPLAAVYVSVTTVAGRKVAEQRLKALCDGIFYAPIDYCFAVRNVLKRIRPIVLVILETEIWPNLYHEVKKTFAGLLIVNGRISGRAHRRYYRARWVFSEVLSLPDRILAQDKVSRQRFASIMEDDDSPAARTEHLAVGGNLKYDQDPGASACPDVLRAFLERIGPKQTWIAASTMPPASEGDVDEDEAVIAAFARLQDVFRDLLLILVPRRPERFDLAAQRLEASGIPWVRRSQLDEDSALPLPGVLLLDSMGELASLFPLADVVFMGGTLNRRGGHNILEPAACGNAIVIGPHMENFPEIAAEFREAGAAFPVEKPEDLPEALRALLLDPHCRQEMGKKAQDQFLAGKGATQLYADEVGKLYESCVPRTPRSWWHYAFLWPLARLWALGSRSKRERQSGEAKKLPVPVLSVGNLTTGGAGKTPAALWLVDELHARGRAPAILTRGYRRLSREPFLIAGPGQKLARASTGDEAQIFLQRSLAPVGIGAKRYETGLQLLERFPADIFVLDDGFQHWRLARDFDLVLIDALMPFGERDLIPLGRLREPLSALKRADAFLITRTASGARLRGIEKMLRAVNSRAPIFRSIVKPVAWVDAANGVEKAVEDWQPESVAAFCGLANPNSFRQTLRALGIAPKSFWRFSDHHLYAPAELKRLEDYAQSVDARVLLTTEKDFHNLEPDWYLSIRQTPLYWLKITTSVMDGDALVDLILSRTVGRELHPS